MKVTQICFDRIDADGRKWSAVIDYDGGGPTFHSLRGVRSVRESSPPGHAKLNAGAGDAARNSNAPDSMVARPAVFGPEVVACAKDTHRY
jgi:hypothetical protein